MLKTVEAVRERERERYSLEKKSSSKKQSTNTRLCKQQHLLDSLEREHNLNKLSFTFDAKKELLVSIEIIDFNRIRMEKRMDYIAT